MRTAVSAVAVITASWFLFGPVYACHHDTGYGIFAYMFSGGEDADPGDFVFLGERFWFFPGRFAITLAVWLSFIAATARVLHITQTGRSSDELRE